MRKLFFFLLLLSHCQLIAQSKRVNRQLFFLDESVIEATLSTDIRKLRTEKKTPTYQPAQITMRFSDSSIVTENIQVQPRGAFRKDNCEMASLRLNFKTSASPKLSSLKTLKLVGGCQSSSFNEELLLKEYIAYKMYNFITIMSFKVRLLHITYKDSKQKMKSYKQYAFVIEDIDDLAERNNCVEVKTREYYTEACNRQQLTLVNLFQYMIGNTDWAIPKYHNVKLIVPKTDTFAKPYPVPYDFDYCGLVNAPYAIPHEMLNIPNVKTRLYRGFPRTMAELEAAVEIFKEKKTNIMYLINNFSLLNARVRKDMINYLDGFYEVLNSKKLIKSEFIDRARTE